MKPMDPTIIRKSVERGTFLLALLIISLHLSNVGLAAEKSASLKRLSQGAPPRNLSDLRAFEDQVKALARKMRASTVPVQVGAAHGSGVVVTKDGYVMTAAHVIGKPGQRAVIRFSSGDVVRGKTLGLNEELDAGLVKITTRGEWPFLPIRSGNNPRAGLWCLAMGFPGGFEIGTSPLLRMGRVSESNSRRIRTDCALTGGDSGGPLVDINGGVIGIHSSIGESLISNIHVPVSVYRKNWEKLKNGEVWDLTTKPVAFLGITGKQALAEAIVEDIHADSPAEAAGLMTGDRIVSLDDHRIGDFDSLRRIIRKKKIGDRVSIVILRGSVSHTLKVRLGKKLERI